MEPITISKFLLISLFVSAQPGNHNIAMDFENIATVDDAAHCELLAHDLANLGYPPLANVAVERINKCVEVEYPAKQPGRIVVGQAETRVLVAQSAYKWSGVSKPIQIFSVENLTVESCEKAADQISRMTIGHPLAYKYLRVDTICI